MPRQTALRHLRIGIRSEQWDASYVFPFYDAGLRVRFVVLIREVGHFITHSRPRWIRRGRLAYETYFGEQPLRLADTHVELFRDLLHFDPWWTMRDAVGVPSAISEAIIATNIAAHRVGHLMIRDITFSDNLDQVTDVRIGDGVFKPVSYGRLESMPHVLRETFFGSTA